MQDSCTCRLACHVAYDYPEVNTYHFIESVTDTVVF
nr:MAG TPA: hypothetical protein [Caudoviricetes sp.]